MSLHIINIRFLLLAVFIQLHVGNSYTSHSGHEDVTEMTTSMSPVTEGVSRLRAVWNYIIRLKKECVFTCENGGQPEPRPGYVPRTNGCGSYGISFDFMNDIPAVQDCCHGHDTCYHTCGQNHSDCDDTFRTCLFDYCRHRYENDDVTDGNGDLRMCRRLAETAYASVQLFGCKAYNNDQEAACVCPQLITWDSLTDWWHRVFHSDDEDRK